MHWLKDVSLKSQKEIIAQGDNVKANLRKLNIAQISGIAYSAIMLGVLLPKLNIWMTRKKGDYNRVTKQPQKYTNMNFKSAFVSMEKFAKRSKIADK